MHCKDIHIFIAGLTLYLKFSFVYLKALVGKNIRQVNENEFPSVVCLKEVLGEGHRQEKIICTGTLISLSHFLSSEHCFEQDDPSRPLVLAGESFNLRRAKKFIILWWQSYEQWAHRVNITVQRPINDIAVGKIRGTVRADIIPAVVSTIPAEQLYGLNVKILGFGLTNTGVFKGKLDVATVKIITKRRCNKIVSEVEGSPSIVDTNLLCTIVNPYVLVDLGDSGGPIFLNNTVVGVNMGSCPELNYEFHAGKVNVHVNVALYSTFIIHSMER